MDEEFKAGFEKIALLKEIGLAGALALSGVAKAGGSAAKSKAKSAIVRALKEGNKSEIRAIEKKLLSKVNKKVDSILPGKAKVELSTNLNAPGTSSAALASKPQNDRFRTKFKPSLKNLGKINVSKENLHASLSPEKINARFNVGKNSYLEGSKQLKGPKDARIAAGFNMSF